jgi:acyl-CoA thioesterase FadM
MILYMRFLLLCIRCLFLRKQKTVLSPARLRFRVLPFDCDLNFHLNNARYLSFMDLGRWHLLAVSGLFKQVRKHRWLPVIAGLEITFLRPINPLQAFDLVTRVLAWDDRYVYLEQRFIVKGSLMATALVKGAFIARKKRVSIYSVIKAVEPGLHSPPMPDVVLHWQALAQLKKKSSTPT